MTWLDILKLFLALVAGSFLAGFIATWLESRIIPTKRTNDKLPGTKSSSLVPVPAAKKLTKGRRRF